MTTRIQTSSAVSKSMLIWAFLMCALAWMSVADCKPDAPPAEAADPLVLLSQMTKIFATVLTAIATLIGLPLGIMRYRKMRADITKTELESAKLRLELARRRKATASGEADVTQVSPRQETDSVVVLSTAQSSGRLLLDFIVAWCALTLAGLTLSIVEFGGILKSLAMAALGFLLLFPLFKQAVQIRARLQPRSREEIDSSARQAKWTVLALYLFVALAILAFGILLWLYELEWKALAWVALSVAVVLLVLTPFVGTRVERYALDLLQPEVDA